MCVPTRRYDHTWLDSNNGFWSRLRQTNIKRQTDRQTQNSFLHSNNNNFMFCQWKRWTQPNLISTFFSLLLFLCSQVTRYPSTTNQPRVQLLSLIPPYLRFLPISASLLLLLYLHQGILEIRGTDVRALHVMQWHPAVHGHTREKLLKWCPSILRPSVLLLDPWAAS